MLQRRTDLAVEEKVLRERAGELTGVKSREKQTEGFDVTEVRVVSPAGAEADRKSTRLNSSHTS